MTTPTYTPEQLREYAADIERHQNTVAVEGCDPAWMVARLRELAAAQSELAAIKSAVESSGDEIVRELTRVVFPSLRDYGQGYSAAVAERAAARITQDAREIAALKGENEKAARLLGEEIVAAAALRAELASVKAERDESVKRAFQLGQTYWQQADSQYESQNRKSDETMARYKQLLAGSAAKEGA